jgi:cell division protein FtsQ
MTLFSKNTQPKNSRAGSKGDVRGGNKSTARGASSRRPKPSRVFNWQKLLPLFGLLSVLLMAAAVYQGGRIIVAQPVTRVVVNGEYQYVDKQAIIQQVEPFLAAGFVRLDLAGIREQLIGQPWVYEVMIARHWPDEIVITVVEQTPIASWGKDGFLNHRGELFKPAKTITIAGLPRLQGPDNEAERVMSHYRELNVTLAADNLALVKLELNERGSWSAQLGNGIEIVFGSGELMGKIRRLLFAYDLGLSADFERIKTIDMRYNNGFAVAWQQQKS